MAGKIQTWPDELNRAVTSSFTLASLNLSAQPLLQPRPVTFGEPFDRRFFVTIQSPTLGEIETTLAGKFRPSWREVEGRIARMRGVSGQVRLFDPGNIQPAFNIETAATRSHWSGGRSWVGGAEWISGALPPFVTVDEAAALGDESVVLRGLPVSTARVLRWGDRLEFRPDGTALDFGAYHIIAEESGSDSAGKTRVYLEPGLRLGLNIGDQVVLKYPTSVFSLATEREGEVQRDVSAHGSFGWSLIEALRFDP